MRFATVRVSLFFFFLALLAGVTLLVVSLVEVAVGAQRSAQAQNLPTVSVSCPASVAAVAQNAVTPGTVTCTFTVAPAPTGSLTIQYSVAGAGNQTLDYSQSLVTSQASEAENIHYTADTTSVTVALVADSTYTIGSPSDATVAVGTSAIYSGVGLHVNETGALDGYTLLTGAWHNSVYLIDNEGRKAYSWDIPDRLVKLLDSGNLATGNIGSSVREIGSDGTAVYQYTAAELHHDIAKLANGNFLFINSEYYTRAQSIAAGADPSCLGTKGLEVDSIIEIKPTGSNGGTVVWKWNVWDHLIQDHDSTKDNYGTIADHPELIDINYGICQIRDGSNGFLQNPHHLTHLNSIDYNASLDQILITSRHFSEAWVIDHSTTTTEAATSSGGNSNQGGNLLYRYGNPRTHDNGSKIDQRLFFPHNAHWIPSGLQGTGNVLIYNNGHEHPGFLRNHASADELAFPSSGHTYLRAGKGFMLPTLLWTHRLAEHTWIMSNAQRLPNGNTLITEGNHARISEVTSDGTVVWHYISPLARGTEIVPKGDSPANSSDTWVYRAYKYAANHPGITALTLIPSADRVPLTTPPPVCTVTPTSTDLVDLVRSYHETNRTRSNYSHNWLRVLIAFGVETSDTLEPFTATEATAAEQIWNGWQAVRQELERIEQEKALCASPTTPVVSITAGSDVTEGSAASFTLTATPTPSSSLTVTVNVTASGSFGVTTGNRTVTIPTSGTATLTVSTTGDTTDETDGSVTATITDGATYDVDSTATSATVNITDDDNPPTPVVSITAGSDVTEGSAASFTLTATPTPSSSLTVTVNVTASGSFGVTTGNRTVTIPTSGTATLTVSTTGDTTDETDGSVTATITDGATYDVDSTATSATVNITDDDNPPTPVVSITAGSDVTEGSAASFTLTATPTPSSSLTVTVNVTASGSFGVTTGNRTVTIPTSGTATLTVSTTGDTTDETDGSVTATITDGATYDVDSTATSATVNITDDDNPPTPVVSITAGSDVTEGSAASFTLTATPTPSSSLTVTVNVTASGSFGVTTGNRTVTIPTSGTATLTVSTTGDTTDETDGSVTATITDGATYDVDSTATSATVNITDDDQPAGLPSLSIADGTHSEDDIYGYYLFFVTLSRPADKPVRVSYAFEPTGTGTGHATINDYQPISRTIYFQPGNTSGAGLIVVKNDNIKEPDETLRIVITNLNPETAVVGRGTATLTIEDDD